MSLYQKKVLYRSIIIGALWIFFAQKYLFVWWRVSISGFLSIVFLWLRMWWRQAGIWIVALFSSMLTFLGFLFGAIPVYTATPSLDAFYASKFPTLQCKENTAPLLVQIWKIEYTNKTLPSINDLCNKNFPIYVGQQLSWNDSGVLIINIGNGSSFYIQGPVIGNLTKTTTWYTFDREKGAGKLLFYWPDAKNDLAQMDQLSITSEYIQEKKAYLQKNFPRTREQSVRMTKVAIAKMKILGLFNREFNNYVKNLQYYMEEISN